MSEEKKIELLEELVKWVRVTSIPKVKELLETLVQTPEEKRVYTLSDGLKTTREIEKVTKTGKDAVSRLWKKWIRVGISEPVAVAGGGNRARSLFSLEDFGIEIPKDTQTSQENKSSDKSNKSEV